MLATGRANARLALALAIGELQRRTGADTWVTAPADILDNNNPPVLGVRTSWRGQGPRNHRDLHASGFSLDGQAATGFNDSANHYDTDDIKGEGSIGIQPDRL